MEDSSQSEKALFENTSNEARCYAVIATRVYRTAYLL